MNVMFLDVDGVLNSVRSFAAGQARLKAYSAENPDDPYWLKITKCTIDPIAVDLINRACRESDVKIVISSTHRMHVHDSPTKLDELKNYFGSLGINPDYVIDWTARLHTPRGVEIQDWLIRHPEVKQYVIVDDDSDMLPEQMGNFVRCDGDIGLSYKNFVDICTLFGYEDSGIII